VIAPLVWVSYNMDDNFWKHHKLQVGSIAIWVSWDSGNWIHRHLSLSNVELQL
jgi:hypothetical protein